jgi:hypothetical protein
MKTKCHFTPIKVKNIVFLVDFHTFLLNRYEFQKLKLNFAGGLGDASISAMIEQERAKAAKEQQQVNRKEFDARVMEETSATTKSGDPRDMTSRRREFIQKEAQKESKGTKSLADIYQVLNDALTKITSSPIISV